MSKRIDKTATGSVVDTTLAPADFPHPLAVLCPVSARRRILRWVVRSLRGDSGAWDIDEYLVRNNRRNINVERGFFGVNQVSVHGKSFRVPLVTALHWRLRLRLAIEAARIRQAYAALFG